MSFIRFLILIPLLISSALAGEVLDVVFDIDQTVATLVHEGPYGDLLKDPKTPEKGIVSIQFNEELMDEFNRPLLNAEGKTIITSKSESYRVFTGVSDLLSELKRQQAAGKVRVSFFSGGFKERNENLLKQIILDDGTSAFDLISEPDGKVRSFNRGDLTPTGVGKEGRVRERFKKDLTLINKNLDNIILVDDIKTFVPKSQEKNILWLGENFPYPERLAGASPRIPDHQTYLREKNKMAWVSDVLLEAIDNHHTKGFSFASSIEKIKTTPFTEPDNARFIRGKIKILKARSQCNPKSALRALLEMNH